MIAVLEINEKTDHQDWMQYSLSADLSHRVLKLFLCHSELKHFNRTNVTPL